MSAGRANSEDATNVVRRIRRFLDGLKRARRQPNRREAYHICMAIEHLQAGRLSDSETSLQKADRRDPIPPGIATQATYNELPTVEQLQVALDRLSSN